MAGQDLEAGVRNLLFGCGQCRPGDKVLIVRESGADGYCDPGLAPAVARIAEAQGLNVTLQDVPFSDDPGAPGADLADRMRAADCTVFLARLGDQLRFQPGEGTARQIVCYALDRSMMASAFGRCDYRAFGALCRLIDQAIAGADEVHVTCPAGTDLRGRMTGPSGGDTTRLRFPRSVCTPVPSEGFRGRIAQRGFLTGTGSRYYRPYACEVKGTLFVQIAGNRIAGFEGSAADVANARAHYEFVADRFGIDAFYTHSWHAGIHPGCRWEGPASASFERWSGGAFGNPRLLHVHSCGDYPPGEISLNVLDPTVRVDGIPIWDNGRLRPDLLPDGAALLAEYSDLAALLRAPETQVGAGSGGLSYR